MRLSPQYLKRLYETFGNWTDTPNEHNNRFHETYDSIYNKIKKPYDYVRDVTVLVGAYLPRFVLGMTDRVKIWMRYDGDEDTLDHELWHMEGLDEYNVRALMSAGIRPNRSKWRIIKQHAYA